MEDSRIIELCEKRDTEAISAMNDKYGDYCFTVANNILGNREDAEECVNDTWLRTWNAIPPHRPVWLKSFLAKITRNLALDRYTAKNAEKRGGGETELAVLAGSFLQTRRQDKGSLSRKNLPHTLCRVCGFRPELGNSPKQ